MSLHEDGRNSESRELHKSSLVQRYWKPVAFAGSAVALTLSFYGKELTQWMGGARKADSTAGDSASKDNAPINLHGQREKTPKFNPESFVPLAGSVIVNKEIVNPAAPTVLFVADYHPLRGVNAEADMEEAQAMRRQNYAMLKDLILKYGKLAIVVENLPIKMKIEDMQREELQSDINYGILHKIATTKDMSAKEALANEALSNETIPAPMVLFTVYPDRVELIPSGTIEEVSESLQLVEAGLLADRARKFPAEFDCPDFSVKNSIGRKEMTYAEAIAAFEKGSEDPEVVACYCDFRTLINGVYGRFETDRYDLAPVREMRAAMDVSGDVIVVSCGPAHLPKAYEMGQAAGVNLIAVVPESIEAEVKEQWGVRPLIQRVPDNNTGTCKKYEAEMEAKMLEGFLQNFLGEEE